MAYNKSKGKQKHGDVIYDKDTDTQIDFEQNEIKFRTGGSVRGSFTDGGLSVTGSHIIVGEISSSLGYSGSTGYFNREVIAGVISGSQVEALAGYFDIIASPNNGEANARTIITSGGILSSSQTTALNALDIGEGTFTVSKEGVVASSGSISGTVLSGSNTATFHALDVGQGTFTVSSEGAVATATTIDATGDLTAGTITMTGFTVDSDGDTVVKTISGSSNADFAGTLKAANEGFTVDADGDTAVKTLASVGSVSGSIVTANSAKLHTIGSDALATNITLDVDGVKFARGLSGSSHGYGLDWPGSASFGQGMATISAVGALAAPSVASTTTVIAGTTVTAGTTVSGATAQANRLTVNEIGTDDDIAQIKLTNNQILIDGAVLTSSRDTDRASFGGTLTSSQGNFHVDGAGAIYANSGHFTVGVVSADTGYVSASSHARFGGSLETSDSKFTVSATGVVSASGGASFGQTLSAANSGFTVDADGDTSVKSLTSEGVISGSSVTADTARIYQIGAGSDPDVMILRPAGANVTQFTTAISSSGYISGTIGRFEDYVTAPVGAFATLEGVTNLNASTISGSSFSGSEARFYQIGVGADADLIVLDDSPAINVMRVNGRISSSNSISGTIGFFEEYVTSPVGAFGAIEGLNSVSVSTVSGSSFSGSEARFYQIGVGADADLLVLSDSTSPNQLGVNGAISASHHITASHAFFEDYVIAAVGSFGSLDFGGQALSGASVVAHAVTASFIGPQNSANLFKLVRPTDGPSIFAGPFSGSGPKSYALDWPGLVRLAGNTVRFTHQGTGSMQQLIVSGNIEASSRAIIGTGITASANQFIVDGTNGRIFTSGAISGSSHLDVGGDIRARQGSLTMAGTLNLGGGNIINASGVSGSGNVTFGGKLEMLGKEFKIDNQADLSSSGDIEIYGKLEVGGENFTVQQDGDLSGSGYAYFAGKLEAAARGFRVDSDGDTIVKSLSSSLSVAAEGFSGDGAIAMGGNISGAVLSGSATATLHSLNVGQGAMTVSKEGSLRAKQIHMTSHKFTPGNSTAHFVRFDTNGADASANDNNKLTAPYSGKLIKVAARATNAAGSTVISLHTNVDGNQNVNGTATEAITVDMSAANTTYTFTFTDSANYGPGDIVGIKFNPTNDPGTPTLTAVWEFDHNS